MNQVTKEEPVFPNYDTVTLYQYIYKNAQVGMGSLGKLLEGVCCGELTETLRGQQRGYTAIFRVAAAALARSGIRPIGMRPMEKIHTCFTVRMTKMRKGNSLPRIAGMVILGTTMGSIEAAKKKSTCPLADEDSKALMERLIRFEEASCRNLRSYL